ncbi:MAG: DUF1254 domain-containing protein [Nitrospira sp.]|nr:DUF1254 domain-containing protein [Nitrospira sp.]
MDPSVLNQPAQLRKLTKERAELEPGVKLFEAYRDAAKQLEDAAQILDEWGEVITNINERNYPSHPHGRFALVAPGSAAKIPEDTVRIELHSRKAKLLGRVELKTDPAGAMALQKQFALTPLGKPVIQPAAPMATFGNEELIGVELFDNVEAVLTSATDVSPIATQMQAKVRGVAQQAIDPKLRHILDQFIKREVVPQFLKYAVSQSGVFKNNWLGTLGTGNYGSDYWKRSSANLIGLGSYGPLRVRQFVQDTEHRRRH